MSERKAGRELDTEIHRVVFGEKACPCGIRKEGYDPDTGKCRQCGNGVSPYYSTDVAAAFTIVEKLRLAIVPSEDGWYAIKPDDIDHGCVRGTSFPKLSIIGQECEEFIVADTPSLAICLAALAAIEGDKSHD